MYYNPTYPNNFVWNQPNNYTRQDVVRVNGENGAKARKAVEKQDKQQIHRQHPYRPSCQP